MALDLLAGVTGSLIRSNVGIEEFAESDEYCNKRLYPRQLLLLKLIFLEELTNEEEDILDYWISGGRGGNEITISPNIRERVGYLKDKGYKHFREVVLVGGRRSSKGFTTGMALSKVMWDTLQLQDPHKYYGIDRDKDIYFSCVAGSEAQAKEFQFGDFVGNVSSCVSFEPYVTKALETEFHVATPEDLRKIAAAKTRGKNVERSEARLRGKALAANAGTLRGSATMALCIDEMAHMVDGISKASAAQVYDAATPALDQFGRDGMIFCNSSPYSKVGMFYERHMEALKTYNSKYDPGEDIGKPGHDVKNGSPFALTLQYPSWALFEGYKHYKSKYSPGEKIKKIITVSPDWDTDGLDADGEPFTEQERIDVIQARNNESSNAETYKVERRGKFAEVTDAYLNPAMVERIFRGLPGDYDDRGRLSYHPFDTNYGQGISYLHRYKAHLDPSSTTAGFGFAMAHSEEFADINGNMAPHVVFDIVKRWNPKDFPGETIDWRRVLAELIEYIDLFRPYEVTFDQFQSVEPIQNLQYTLQDRGIGGVYVGEKTATLEHNWFRAETFKTAMNHGLIHAPNDTEDLMLVENELKFLQQKNTGGRHPRVDKQDSGPVQTKDMADCMMECVETLIGNQLQNIMRERAVNNVMATGAQGGFRIGGDAHGFTGTSPHPELAGFYKGTRLGEQASPAGARHDLGRGAVGGALRGISRGGRRATSRGR